MQLCLLPVTISKIQGFLAGRFKRRRRKVSHEENEEAKVHKGFLYEEKKECFTRRKQRFEDLKLFSIGRRKNVSHEENEDSKVYKGFLYEEKKECFTQRKRRFEGLQRFFSSCRFMGLRVLFQKYKRFLSGALRGEECFTRRKRRFEGLQRFFSSGRFMWLTVLFQKHKPFLPAL